MSESSQDQSSNTGAETTQDWLLGRRLRLRQPAAGYRAGLDAALLAAACDANPGERVLDLGCGPGAVMLAAALRRPGARFTGLERDPSALTLAEENIVLNSLGDRVSAMAGAVRAGFAALECEPFDAVLCNPPFFDDPGSLRRPRAGRVQARLADEPLELWTAFLLKAVRDGGTVTMIHRADRLGDLIGQLSAKAGSIRIRAVHPFADQPAKRVLVRAIRSGRAPLQLLAPLILHDRSGAKHTPEVEAILRGEAALGW